MLACRLSSDAVLAYDGALSFHHLGGDDVRISFLTAKQIRPFSDEQVFYTPVRPPAALGKKWRAEVIEAERGGEKVFVTSIERTLVDVLDRLDLLRRVPDVVDLGVDKLRKAFATLDLDIPRMVHHARALGGGLLASRLGFFLEFLPAARRDDLGRLEKRRPTSPAYFDRTDREEEMVFLNRWNLLVPKPLWLRVARGAL